MKKPCACLVASSMCSPFLWALAGLLLAVTAFGADKPGPGPADANPSSSASERTDTAKSLFDGKTLKGWKVTDFAGHGEVAVDPAFKVDAKAASAPAIVLDMGAVLTGITWTNKPPSGEYEIAFETAKLDGSDFFGAITFPAGEGHCTLIVGGWGGGLVGISSLDGMDASENETTKFLTFQKNRWYQIRVRVTKPKIEAWIDTDKVVDLTIADRRIAVRAGEIELAQPLGISAYQTRCAIRNVRLRSL